jgi:myo-inositol-1(or 4)-monophosphatase
MILTERPDDGILGEEGAARAGTSGVRWVIDPLDGTTNYVYGLPLWCVSIAAEVDAQTAVGVVHAPALGLTYVGVAGRGSLERSRRGERPLEQRRRQAEALVEVAPRVRDVRRLGSAAIDLCWVAAGHTDAYVESRLHPWDVAAGALIAREAGAIVVGDADPILAPYVMACAPGIYASLTALLDRS